MKEALILENWAEGPEVGRLVEFGVAAEAAGWDGVFLIDVLVFPVPEDFGMPSTTEVFHDFADPWIVLAGIAARTERIRLGSWVTPVARRQPWQLARDLATLDRISGGRVILGAGLGRRPDYEIFGDDWDWTIVARKYDEALEIMAKFWSGDNVIHQGEFFTVDRVALLPTPLQSPRIPVWIAAVWPNKKPFHRAARWDGLMPHFPGDGTLPTRRGLDPYRAMSEMLNYYHGVTDDPGDIFLPRNPPDPPHDYLKRCRDSGVTWLYTRGIIRPGDPDETLRRIAQGPKQ